MKLEDLNVYQISMKYSEEIYTLVSTWDYFSKDTIGKQLVRASDSISANISEGFGRYHYKDHKRFLYFSRGSLFEAKTWLTKANNRKLINNEKYKQLIAICDDLGVRLNNYIISIGNK
ncbi:MAG: four helix bundle protein [Bacteroidota bacterium]|nr:four helix bundle protein [Bacteroidota bacterium]